MCVLLFVSQSVGQSNKQSLVVVCLDALNPFVVVCGRGRYAVTGLKICGCCAFLLAGNASSIRPPNGIVLRGWWDGQTGILRKKQTNGDETDKTARWRILPCVCVYGVLVYPWSCSSGSVQSLFGMNQPMTFSVCVCVCLGGFQGRREEKNKTERKEGTEGEEEAVRLWFVRSCAEKKSHTERQDKQDNSKQAATTSDTTQRLKNKKPATDTRTHTPKGNGNAKQRSGRNSVQQGDGNPHQRQQHVGLRSRIVAASVDR